MSEEKQPVQEDDDKKLSANQRARQEALETLHQVLHRAAISGELPQHEASMALRAVENYNQAIEELLLGFQDVLIGFSQMFAAAQTDIYEMNLVQKSVEKVLMNKSVVSLNELEDAARELHKAYRDSLLEKTQEESSGIVN